jgi:hypothetical protein
MQYEVTGMTGTDRRWLPDQCTGTNPNAANQGDLIDAQRMIIERN